MKPIRLAVFDLEGTIFRNSYKGGKFPSLWAVLCNQCGMKACAEDEVNRKKFYNDGYCSTSFADTYLIPTKSLSAATTRKLSRGISV